MTTLITAAKETRSDQPSSDLNVKKDGLTSRNIPLLNIPRCVSLAVVRLLIVLSFQAGSSFTALQFI